MPDQHSEMLVSMRGLCQRRLAEVRHVREFNLPQYADFRAETLRMLDSASESVLFTKDISLAQSATHAFSELTAAEGLLAYNAVQADIRMKDSSLRSLSQMFQLYEKRAGGFTQLVPLEELISNNLWPQILMLQVYVLCTKSPHAFNAFSKFLFSVDGRGLITISNLNNPSLNVDIEGWIQSQDNVMGIQIQYEYFEDFPFNSPEQIRTMNTVSGICEGKSAVWQAHRSTLKSGRGMPIATHALGGRGRGGRMTSGGRGVESPSPRVERPVTVLTPESTFYHELKHHVHEVIKRGIYGPTGSKKSNMEAKLASDSMWHRVPEPVEIEEYATTSGGGGSENRVRMELGLKPRMAHASFATWGMDSIESLMEARHKVGTS